MKFPKLSDKSWYNGAVIACIGVAFYVFLTNLGTVIAVLGKIIGYFRPVILGVVIAYVISPLANLFFYRVFRRMKSRKIRWYLSVALSYVLMLLAFFFLIGTLLPQLIQSIVMLSQNFDSYAASLIRMVQKSPLSSVIDETGIEVLSENIMSTIKGIVSGAADDALKIAASAGKHVISTVIGLILAVYLLIDVRNVLVGVRRFMGTILPPSVGMVIMDFVLRCDTILVTYIAESLMDAVIIGAINAVFMLICKMPYVGLISVIVAVTNLVPNFGPAIGAVIGAFILLLVNPMQTAMFLVFCLIVQSFDAYILKPKLFSSALGVSGLAILISTIVLGNMFGILGVLFSIPTAAIISFIYHDYYLAKRMERRKKRRKSANSSDQETVNKV